MEVKPGHKLAEVGVIPEEWELKPFVRFCVLQRGFDITEATRRHGDVPVYSSSGLAYYHDKAMVAPPGIVTGRKGMLGKVFFVDRPFWPHDTTLWVKDFKGNDPAFVALVLSRLHLERFDAATSVPTLNRNNFVGIPLAVPPLPEQRAIAAALEDVDSLLGSVDRLIVKKRDLKQAAMQQLLTGKRRLPGFSYEWEMTRLGEIAEILNGGTPKTGTAAYWDGGIKWCTPTDITGTSGNYLFETERTISDLGLKNCSAQLLPKGALLLCSRATIGEVKIAGIPCCTNQGFKSLVCGPKANNEFLYYLLLTMKAQMLERAIGSTFLEISKKDTAALRIRLPKTDEQAAIAEVLSDMDAEIAALEHRRDKTKLLKEGMMQELLTGRTRLV
jgi:type I restriction enzyme S subunit